MNSNRSALDALTLEGILMSEEQLLRETRKVQSNSNGSTPAPPKGLTAYNNVTSPSMTAVKAKSGSGHHDGASAQSRAAAGVFSGATVQAQPLEEAPAAACYPTDALEERGGPSVDDFAYGLGFAGALVGAIAGPVLAVVAGETDAAWGAFFGGLYGGGIAGFILGGAIGTALWSIGTHEEEADIAPAKLTPSDNAALDRLTRTRKEEHGHVWVEVDLPSPAPVDSVNRLLSTALLAREEAGEIRLEILGGKLVASPTGNTRRWPGDSLELGLCKPGPVYATIFEWIGSNSSTPTGYAMQRILASLAKRTLLDVERKRILGRFTMTSSHYLLPQRTAGRLVERPDRLIEECRRTRPEVHAALTKDIEKAFAERYEEPPPAD